MSFKLILKFMKNICFIILVFLSLFLGKAQNNKFTPPTSKKTADSLVKIAVKKQELGEFMSSLPILEKCIVFYQNNKNIKEVGDCFSYISNIYYYQGDYTKSLLYSEKSLSQYKKVKYNKGISADLNNIGGLYYLLGNYPKALEYFKNAIVIQDKIEDKIIAATTTQNIGLIYIKTLDYENALKYTRKAHNSFLKLNDKEGITRCLNTIGFIYIKTKDFQNAEENLNKSYNIAKKIENKQLLTETLSNLGELYFRKKDFQKSLSFYNLCLKYALEINSLQFKTESQVAIGNIQSKLGNYSKSISHCKEGLKMAEKLGSISLKKDACNCLYDAYKSTGNTNLALLYHEKFIFFQDSLQVKETANQVMDMEFQNTKLLDSISNVKKAYFVQLKHKEEVSKQQKQRNIIILSLLFILIFAVALWSRLRFVSRSKKQLQVEKDRSEKLLLNILPAEIAEELKQNGSVNAKDFNLASILFTDFKSFTQTAESMTPQDLVEEINVCFKAFDEITEFYKIEKIKTIGDAYMAAGGIPVPDKNSLLNIVLAGLEMQEFVTKRKLENDILNKPSFEMRLGIHAGPIVAGIVGIKKFQYDVWGDTVNTASRLESNGMVGKVNISESLYQHIKDLDIFTFEYRGKIDVKGKGEINMYFVEKK